MRALRVALRFAVCIVVYLVALVACAVVFGKVAFGTRTAGPAARRFPDVFVAAEEGNGREGGREGEGMEAGRVNADVL